MTGFLPEFTIREIFSQCTFAIKAHQNIDIKAGSTDVVYSSIHSFLSHCRNVWMLLVNKNLAEEIHPRTIMQLLGVNEATPLSNTKLRNMLEHYDERLYKWIKAGAEGAFVLDSNVGSKQALGVPENSVRVRHYDFATDTFSMLNNDLPLQPMLGEAMRVRKSADAWLALGSRVAPKHA